MLLLQRPRIGLELLEPVDLAILNRLLGRSALRQEGRDLLEQALGVELQLLDRGRRDHQRELLDLRLIALGPSELTG
eukprot:9486501-Pyramimonas_sp.AAC.1